ncbi:MAG TPA: hypothetical protein VIK45_06905 [Candidatus Dormibacteraeota bacterium]
MLVSFFVLLALVPIAYVLWFAWWLVASLGDRLHPAYLPVPVRLSRPVSAEVHRTGEERSTAA